MGKTYRIRTDIGVDQQITVNLEQDYELLEILSLKIRQSDLYLRNCSNYGVVVGRVTANGGYGIPNAKISVFIPLDSIDQNNPLISTLYPYTDLNTTNEDGYRYNLLPYVPSYSGQVATGTFPDRYDVLTNNIVGEIYQKYYKFAVKTNSSGDYMILGIPPGTQTLHMDVDLSDIGDFSLTPQDLIRMGLATVDQFDGVNFKASADLATLPQIVTLNSQIEVPPLWGEPSTCQIGIARADFDLSAKANINIQPTAIFMGSIMSTTDTNKLSANCDINKNVGKFCNLTTGPGQILGIRHTINQDGLGRPILELATDLPNGGQVIDENGAFMFDLPMNMDYVTTNEFGQQILSNDPTIGIPTKSRYRFKMKWNQSNNISEGVRRAYFLVPNIKEYGWNNGNVDPVLSLNPNDYTEFQNSYGFDLDWSGYTNPTAAINCEDTFYEFHYNKVYTVSQLMDNFKTSNKSENFLSVKQITDRTCEGDYNVFPVNDATRDNSISLVLINFLLFLFRILLPVFINLYKVVQIVVDLIYIVIIGFLCSLCNLSILGVHPFRFICKSIHLNCDNIKPPLGPIKLPMLTYPDCTACDCSGGITDNQITLPQSQVAGSITGELNSASNMLEGVSQNPGFQIPPSPNEVPLNHSDIGTQVAVATVLAGDTSDNLPHAQSQTNSITYFSLELPLNESINLFNTRGKYHDGKNVTRVQVEPNLNPGQFHTDNLIVVVLNSFFSANTGTLLTFVNPQNSTDPNITNAPLNVFGTTSITGITSVISQVNIGYSDITNPTLLSNTLYNLPPLSGTSVYSYPSDIEYYQVVTGTTIGQLMSMSSSTTVLGSFINLLFEPMSVIDSSSLRGWDISPLKMINGYQDLNVLFIQRGVDPYSPIYNMNFDLSSYYGYSTFGNVIVNGNYRLNIPIQPTNGGYICADHSKFLNNDDVDAGCGLPLFYESVFKPDPIQYSAYTSTNYQYYSDLSWNNRTASSDGVNQIQAFVSYVNFNNQNAIISTPSNLFSATAVPVPNKYSPLDNLDGGSYMYENLQLSLQGPIYTGYYFSPIYNPTTQINMRNTNLIVMRSDRLPSSDSIDPQQNQLGNSTDLLQQNNYFAIYKYVDNSIILPQISFAGGSGPSQGSNVTTTNYFGTDVLQSFGCQGMTTLECYENNFAEFSVKPNCDTNRVVNGCYVFARLSSFSQFIADLFNDVKFSIEYGYRLTFLYNVCRGVISESFINNWVNGVLFMPAFENNIVWNNQNLPEKRNYCIDVIALHDSTATFYYRSSPTNAAGNFIGRPGTDNNRNLMYPTTIMNLGPKNAIIKNYTLSPDFDGYNADQLPQTSYSDTSDILNLFIISRMTYEGFLKQLISFDVVGNLFSRPQDKIDADYAQTVSINSEHGVIKFSPTYYESAGLTTDPIVLLGTSPSSVMMGIFFSSSTVDLQNRDFISPGRVDIWIDNDQQVIYENYGIQTQLVPFYQWKLVGGASIFGIQTNNWGTQQTDIIADFYQKLDRTNIGFAHHFLPQNLNNNMNMRGYIFNRDNDGSYDYTAFPGMNTSFLVGAPWHFYFGLKAGRTAMDQFYSAYINSNNDVNS